MYVIELTNQHGTALYYVQVLDYENPADAEWTTGIAGARTYVEFDDARAVAARWPSARVTRVR